MNEQKKSDAQAIIEFARKTTEPQVHGVTAWGREEQVIFTAGANGDTRVVTARSLFGDMQPAPVRRIGTICTHDLASFIAAVNRDKRPDTVIFADVPNRSLTAVLDFHGPADSAPRWGKDRVVYGFKFSQQFEAWCAVHNGGSMNQKTFSTLIDDRLGDIGEGPFAPGTIAAEFARRRGIKFADVADLIVFTRAIAGKSATESEELFDEATGSSSIQYKKKNDIKTPDGQPVPVPAAFVLKIPVLNGIGATEFNIPARLKFDVGDRGIAWRVELHAVDKYVEAAIAEAVGKVRESADAGGCGLPVLMASAP
jgi:uncharacterized protein YfdQ (DUF2303 family)